MQVNGCFDPGMCYVSLSRVRKLSGLRFQRHCPHSLDCEGCSTCALRLTPASVRAHQDVTTYYALALELEAATNAAAERFAAEGPPAIRDEIARLCTLGPAAISRLCLQLSERIDVPQPLRLLASQLHIKAQALNPGQRGNLATSRSRQGTTVACIEGWWNIPPASDSNRTPSGSF